MNPQENDSSSTVNETVIDRFEQAWAEGKRPDIDHFLTNVQGDSRQRLLLELVHIDLECRLKSGESARIEEYLGRFPAIEEDRSALLELVLAEHRYRRRAEPQLALAEFKNRFPQLRELLQDEASTMLVAAGGTLMNSEAQFVELLKRSNLVSEETLAALRNRTGAPAEIAQHLAGEKLLTHWQAEQLLAGHAAFFLGRYKLLEAIGAGGMGSVFKAEQAPMNRVVALKVIGGNALKVANAVTRFRREIQAASVLDHPNIVRAFDADHVKDTHFLVMEFVDGKDLGWWVKRRHPLPISWAVECTRQAAVGLDAAASRGMVHRDIKPSNLLIVQAESQLPLVKIADFGLAQIPTEDDELRTLTATGQVLGTPDFISPEQALDAHSADIRSDIFSLGCTLFYALTKRFPFEGGSLTERLLARTQHDAPGVRDFRADVSEELERVLVRMLARDPDKRFQTPREAAEALGPFAENVVDNLPRLPGSEERADPDADTRGTRGPVAVDEALAGFLHQLDVDVDLEDRNTSIMGDVAPTGSRRSRGMLKRVRGWSERDRRRAIGMALVLLLVLGGITAYALWWRAGSTVVTIQWPEEDRAHGTLEVNGVTVSLPSSGPVEIEGREGPIALRLERPGHHPIEYSFTLERGERRTIAPEWKLTPQGRSDQQIDRFTEQLYAGKLDDPSTAENREAREELRQLLARTKDIKPRQRIEKLLFSQIPWPCDGLRRADIPEDMLRITGVENPQKVPSELVAVFGDGRFRRWRHAGEDIAVSPDGRLLASCGLDYRLLVWECETGNLRFSLPGTQARAEFSTDSQKLYVGTRNQFSVVDCKTGSVRFLRDFVDFVTKIAVSSRSQIALCVQNDSVYLLDAANYRIVKSFSFDGKESPRTIAFSRDGKLLAIGGKLGTVIVRDLESGRELFHQKVLDHALTCVAFSPDGKTLAVCKNAGGSPKILLWDLKTSKQVGTLDGQRVAAFSHDGKLLAYQRIGQIIVWDRRTKRVRHTLSGHIPFVNDLEFGPDSRKLFSCGVDSRIRVWDVETGNDVTPTTPGISAVALSPDGASLAFGYEDGAVRIIEILSGKETARLPGFSSPVQDLAFSPDGTMLAAGASTFRLWDLKSRSAVISNDRILDFYRSFSFDRSGRRLFFVSQIRTAHFYDVERRKPIASWSIGKDTLPLRVTAAVLSPDGRAVFTAMHDNAAHQPPRMWDSATGMALRTLDSPVIGIPCLALDPNGDLLALGQWAPEIQIFSRKTDWGRVRRLKAPGQVWSLDFSRDGRKLAAGISGAFVSVWDLQKERISTTIQLIEANAVVNTVIFSPDGRHIITLNPNGTVYVLRLEKLQRRSSTR